MRQAFFIQKPAYLLISGLAITLATLLAFKNTAPANAGKQIGKLSTQENKMLMAPGLRIAKHIAGVDYATNGQAGRFDLIFEAIVENTGTDDLSNFSLMDNLPAPTKFGTAFVAVTGAPAVVAIGSHGAVTNATAVPALNASFNGNGDLLAGGGLLKPGQRFVVQFRIEVNPNAAGAPAIPKNQVEGFAESLDGAGMTVVSSDLSDSGFTPNSNNPGRPGDTGGSDDPTPLSNCWSLLGGSITCNTLVQASMGPNCIAAITPQSVLEGEYEHCTGDDLFPLGGYYDIVSVMTLDGTSVPDLDPATKNAHEVGGAFVGKTLFVKVMDVVYKNSCWGKVFFEDKLAPTFNCPVTPVLVDCDVNLANLGAPLATDNCDASPTVSLVGETVIDNNICDDGIYRIRRHFKAVDDYGNMSAICVVEYHLLRPGVGFPEDVVWHCEQYAAFPGIVNPVALNPAVTDTDLSDPDIDVAAALPNAVLSNTGSGIVKRTGGVCGYVVSNSDQLIATCGNTVKIIRTWSVVDWCTGTIVTTGASGEDNVQIIKVTDKTPPVIERQPFAVSANVPGQHPQPCRSQGFLPPPTVLTDNCNTVSLKILTPAGEAVYVLGNPLNGGYIPSPGLPLGSHAVVYQATDACGNQTSLNVMVNVIDDLTPAAVCDEVTVVNLTTSGFAPVYAATFDDGSNDNCCIDHFEVRRMNDPCNDGHDDTVFGPSVIFCCEDVGGAPKTVVFRVYDCHGNFNDCMVQVTVSDKTMPLLTSCPQPKRINCDTYKTDFQNQLAALAGNQAAQSQFLDAFFGAPTFADPCGATLDRTINIKIDQCLEGTITRMWQAKDPSGNQSATCTQNIFVDHVSDWVVSFPPDTTVFCGDSLPDFGQPKIFFESCEMVAKSHSDKVYTTVPGACFKVVRTWTVINWCVVGTLTDQEVTEVPESMLGAPCDLDGDGDCDARTFRDSWTATKRPGASQATQMFDPDTDPDSDPWDGFIEYNQTVKVMDNAAPIFFGACPVPNVSIIDTICTTTVILPTPSPVDCSPNVTVMAMSDLGVGFGPFPNVPPGIYHVTYTAKDNCNNQSICLATFHVRDAKKPTVYCQGLMVELMNSTPPMVPVKAIQLDKGSKDNCGGPLKYSFSSDVTDTLRIYGCADSGMVKVQLWVTDTSGNQDFCQTFIEIQDNMDHCGDGLVVNVGGTISNAANQPVSNVAVNLSGQGNGSFNTGANGSYQFANIPAGYDLTVTPYKDDNPLNGVTTYDLVLISRHILGIQPLDSPYKLIAADANRSGGVTTFDLVAIRRLILFIDDDFPNNTSWRFVDKKYQFPNPANPWAYPFPEIISMNNVPADVTNANFVAIKTGDVNGSAQVSFSAKPEDRSAGSLLFAIEDRSLQSGEEYTVGFVSNGSAAGFQFTLEFDPLLTEFVEVAPAVAGEENFGYSLLEQGILTASWHDPAALLQEGETAIRLVFRAKQDGMLSQALRLGSRYTPAEAYTGGGDKLDLELAFSGEPAGESFELFQNKPNPFSEFTVIGFRLPAATPATLTVTDISGKIVKTVSGDFSKGYNEIRLLRSDLPASGILYYRLNTPQDNAARMMLLVD
jgi:hypothetical protein